MGAYVRSKHRIVALVVVIFVKNTNREHPATYIWDGFSLVVKDQQGQRLPLTWRD